MRVLVACEFSGRVRDAFLAKGHDAWSCDLIPTETPGPHIQEDVLTAIKNNTWDLMIAFPPCTYLASSGARWWPQRSQEQQDALKFVLELAFSPIPHIAIENPVGAISKAWRHPNQIIQPWQFGHGETKSTCLWLKALPLLKATNVVSGRVSRILNEPPSKNRWKNRSRTYLGIASAMAEQWG